MCMFSFNYLRDSETRRLRDLETISETQRLRDSGTRRLGDPEKISLLQEPETISLLQFGGCWVIGVGVGTGCSAYSYVMLL